MDDIYIYIFFLTKEPLATWLDSFISIPRILSSIPVGSNASGSAWLLRECLRECLNVCIPLDTCMFSCVDTIDM